MYRYNWQCIGNRTLWYHVIPAPNLRCFYSNGNNVYHWPCQSLTFNHETYHDMNVNRLLYVAQCDRSKTIDLTVIKPKILFEKYRRLLVRSIIIESAARTYIIHPLTNKCTIIIIRLKLSLTTFTLSCPLFPNHKSNIHRWTHFYYTVISNENTSVQSQSISVVCVTTFSGGSCLNHLKGSSQSSHGGWVWVRFLTPLMEV